MKYFRLDFRDATDAQTSVWRHQAEQGAEPSAFSVVAIGSDTCIWTEDAEGESLFVQALLGVRYEETDEETVASFRAQMWH